jgi:hypothetical protein
MDESRYNKNKDGITKLILKAKESKGCDGYGASGRCEANK